MWDLARVFRNCGGVLERVRAPFETRRGLRKGGTMIYVADLMHDGLLKVGLTEGLRVHARQAELRRTLGEPCLKIFLEATVPTGWGSDREWERRLLRNLFISTGRLQFVAAGHISHEVVEASRDDAWRELAAMQRETEVDSQLHAWQLDPQREDWRFEDFVHSQYSGCRYSTSDWLDPLMRQAFLYFLRGEPIARWDRITRGYSCWEVDEVNGEIETQS